MLYLEQASVAADAKNLPVNSGPSALPGPMLKSKKDENLLRDTKLQVV